MLHCGIKCTYYNFTNLFQDLSKNRSRNWEKRYSPLLGNGTPLITQEKIGNLVYGIELDDSICNTVPTLELANVSQLFTSTLKHYNTYWSPNIIQLFMYEAIVKYVIQGLWCVKKRIRPICAKLHIFPKIIKGVPFPENSTYHFP